MMSDIYINEATGKKIKVYQETWVHVWDDADDNLNFWDTAKGVADWCMESVEDDYTESGEHEKCEYCGGNCFHEDAEEICDEYDEDSMGYYYDYKKYKKCKEAYDDEDWLEVIDASDCRYCDHETEERWVVEEVNDEAKV
jgi:hypothetical protein